jgi:polyketide biosynthesis enoyl-CoA hydratase PksH
MVYPFLARRIGSPRAKWLALGGASLSAEEAMRIGLVDQVSADPEAALAECSRRLARTDPRSIARMKDLIARHDPISHQYRRDAAARFVSLLQSPETRDRIARFVEGDAPWSESL